MQKPLTEGDVFTTLLKFSLPFLLTNLLQALYGACDLLVVGRFADSAGVSAVATGGQVMQTVTGLAIGLTTGGTVMVARQFGACRRRELANTAATVLAVFAAISVAMTAAVLALSGRVCAAMNAPAEAMEATRQYLSVCACGIVLIVGYNAVSAILRGMGDSMTPFLFMAVACVVNVLGDLLLVGRAGMGAAGAAVATVLAQAVCLLLALMYLAAKGTLRRFRRGRPCFCCLTARGILAVGMPIALQEGLVNGSFLVITAILNNLGLTASAAVGVAEKLIVFSMLPVTAFASAVAAMTAQNQGAGHTERARQCMRTGIGLSLLFGVACFLCAQVNGPGLIALFSRDPAVIRAGAQYLGTYSLDCVLVCFVFCINGYLSGSSRTVFPLVHSLAATVLARLPLSWLLSRAGNDSLWAVGAAAPVATLFSLVLCLLYLRRMQEKEPASCLRRIGEV